MKGRAARAAFLYTLILDLPDVLFILYCNKNNSLCRRSGGAVDGVNDMNKHTADQHTADKKINNAKTCSEPSVSASLSQRLQTTARRFIQEPEMRYLYATTVCVLITDRNFKTLFMSDAEASAEPPLTMHSVESAVRRPYKLDENTVLKAQAVRGGYVFWREDISAMNSLLRQLHAARAELIDAGDILQEENRQRSHRLRLAEENRLYTMIAEQTAHQTELLQRLIAGIRSTGSLKRAQHLLGQIVVIGTYIKRRSNLIFVDSQHGCIEPGELLLCLKESFSGLELYGVSCSVSMDVPDRPLKTSHAYALYDIFEITVEQSLDSLSMLLMHIEELPAGSAALTPAYSINLSISFDEGTPGTDTDMQDIFYNALHRRLNAAASCISSLSTERDDDMTWCISAVISDTPVSDIKTQEDDI